MRERSTASCLPSALFRRRRRVVGGTGAAWPVRDGSPVSRPPERDRLAAQFGGGGAWRDEYSGALSRIAGALFSARRRGTLSALTSECSESGARIRITELSSSAQLRIIADDCFRRVSLVARRPSEGPLTEPQRALAAAGER